MGEKEITLFKFLTLTFTKHYRSWGKGIIGATINHEYEYVSSNSFYDEIQLKRRKFEFNIWLLWIGLHVTVRGKLKKEDI